MRDQQVPRSHLPDGGTSDEAHLVARRVQAEVEAEAEQLRRDDPDLVTEEKRLLRSWRDIAPPGATGGADELLLDRLERLAHVDVDVPPGARPGVREVKRAIRKTLYWYLRYLADQINAVHGIMIRLLHRVDDRLSTVERALALDTDRSQLIDAPASMTAEAAALAASLCEGDPIAVVSCGDGAAVAAFDPDLVVYGVDADAEVIVEAARTGLDLRPGDPDEHLAGLFDGCLGALVLARHVEDQPASSVHDTLRQALRVVRSRGVIVVAVADPAARGEVERDLRQGRGVAPGTWAHLARRLGAEARLEPVRGDGRIGELVVIDVP